MTQENRGGRWHSLAGRIKSIIPSKEAINYTLVHPDSHRNIGLWLITYALVNLGFDLAKNQINHNTTIVTSLVGTGLTLEGYLRGRKMSEESPKKDLSNTSIEIKGKERREKQNRNIKQAVETFEQSDNLGEALLDLGRTLAIYKPDLISNENKRNVQKALIKTDVLTYTQVNPAPYEEGSANVDTVKYYVEDDSSLQCQALQTLWLLRKQKRTTRSGLEILKKLNDAAYRSIGYISYVDFIRDSRCNKAIQYLDEQEVNIYNQRDNLMEELHSENILDQDEEQELSQASDNENLQDFINGYGFYKVFLYPLFQQIRETEDNLQAFDILQNVLYLGFAQAIRFHRKNPRII